MTETLVQRLRSSRNGRAVLKDRLIKLRASAPHDLIFAFEGDDDKLVFYQWIKRIEQNLHYIPFPCQGKKYVLQLRSVVERDLNGLSRNIFFFVDRDFDDDAPGINKSNTFVTDMYSIENYIVCDRVLKSLLINAYHCHFNMEFVEPIILKFLEIYDNFLAGTKELNFAIFMARRTGMDCRPAPRLSTLCQTTLNEVAFRCYDPKSILNIDYDQSDSTIASLRSEFNNFDARSRYRGKYALEFFIHWLDALTADHGRTPSEWFPCREHRSVVRRQEYVSLSHLATLSPLPAQLEEFVEMISIAYQRERSNLPPADNVS